MPETSASPSFKDILQKSRRQLITTAVVSIISMGITVMACVVAALYMAHVDDLPYRVAAVALVRVAAVTSMIGFAGLCGFLIALGPISRGLASAAKDRASGRMLDDDMG